LRRSSFTPNPAWFFFEILVIRCLINLGCFVACPRQLEQISPIRGFFQRAGHSVQPRSVTVPLRLRRPQFLHQLGEAPLTRKKNFHEQQYCIADVVAYQKRVDLVRLKPRSRRGYAFQDAGQVITPPGHVKQLVNRNATKCRCILRKRPVHRKRYFKTSSLPN
jgi:hypothetical protein